MKVESRLIPKKIKIERLGWCPMKKQVVVRGHEWISYSKYRWLFGGSKEAPNDPLKIVPV